MNNYFVVATAKHPIILRGVQYKIGDTIPTELTEREYEFYKHALNVESMKEVERFANGGIPENNGAWFFHTSNSPELLVNTNSTVDVANYEALKEAFENAIKENETLKALIKKQDKVDLTTETEVKPKRPYAKKETK